MLLVAGLSAAADPQKEQQTVNDRERLQGTWQLVSGERHGKPLPDEVVKQVTLVFAGDKLTTRKKSGASEARFTLHPDTKPAGIDLDMDGSVGLGIYLLEGDRLKLAHVEVGEPRPTGFTGKENPQGTLLILERRKP
jgi:uncharacterized protein (TIGR03067 family)